jgi:hypothetical protein
VRVPAGLSLGRCGLVAALGLIAVSCASKTPQITFDSQVPGSITSSLTVPTISFAPTTTPVPTTGGKPAAGPRVAGPWTAVGANLTALPSQCGDVALVSAGPSNDMVIASVSLQGLWALQRDPSTWVPLGKSPGSAEITNRATSIVYDPARLQTMWESGIYGSGGGVYQTTDGGAVWQQLGNATHSDAVSVDFSDPARSTLLTSTHESSKLYRSTDGGQTWVDISASLPAGIGYATAPYVLGRSTFLLGTNHGSATGVFRTTDAGKTWTRAFSGDVEGEPLVSTSDHTLYWMVGSGGIIKSTDAGVSWSEAAQAGSVFPLANGLVELPDGRLVAVGNGVLVISSDHGATWRDFGPPLPYAPAGVTYSPSRKAVYIWRSQCATAASNAIPADVIMSLSFDYKTQ